MKVTVFMLLFIIYFTGSVIAVPWKGKVIDIRTQKPVAGAKVIGGTTGRVDLTKTVETDASGTFQVDYERETYLGIKKAGQPFILTVSAPFWYDGNGYGRPGRNGNYLLGYSYSTKEIKETTVTLVPFRAYIKGVIRDADTKEPVEGLVMTARNFDRGSWFLSEPTNEKGEYMIKVEAYDNFFYQCEDAVPEEFRRPDETFSKSQSEKFMLYVNSDVKTDRGKKYVRDVRSDFVDSEGKTQYLSIPVISSVSGEVYTKVDALVPSIDSALESSCKFFTITPPGKQTEDTIRSSEKLPAEEKETGGWLNFGSIDEESGKKDNSNNLICSGCKKEISVCKFCPECGAKQIEKNNSCKKCNSPRKGEAKFCGECGNRF